MITGQGKMEENEAGAKRESNEGRGRFDLIPYEAMESLAKWYEDGAAKYGDRNWEKGVSVKDCINRMIRHALKAGSGWTDEDHLSAVMWNAAAAMTMIQRHPEFNDHTWKPAEEKEYKNYLWADNKLQAIVDSKGYMIRVPNYDKPVPIYNPHEGIMSDMQDYIYFLFDNDICSDDVATITTVDKKIINSWYSVYKTYKYTMAEVIQMQKQGLDTGHIMKILKISQGMMDDILADIAKENPINKCVVTEEDQVRFLLNDGYCVDEICKLLGLDIQKISSMLDPRIKKDVVEIPKAATIKRWKK